MYSVTAVRVTKNITLWLISCLLISSCSSLQFAYNQLDWLLLNRADHYLDLTSSQTSALKLEIADLHHWHRTTQLPNYVVLLNNTIERSSNPITQADLIWAEEQLKQHYVEIIERTLPTISTLLRNLDQDQLEYLADQLADDLEERYEYLTYSTHKKLDYRIEKAVEQFEKGYGDLTDQQQDLITGQIKNMADIGALSQDNRTRINLELIRFLAAQPSQAETENYLRAAWLYPEHHYTQTYKTALEQAKTSYFHLTQRIHDLATAEQIDFLQDQLSGYSADLTALTLTTKETSSVCQSNSSSKKFKSRAQGKYC